MPNPGTAPYPVASPGANNAFGSCAFLTNGAASPNASEIYDDDNIISSVVRTGAGAFTVTLSRRWRTIRVMNVELEDTTAGNMARVVEVTDGLDVVNTVKIVTEFADDVPAVVETTDKLVSLVLKLQQH